MKPFITRTLALGLLALPGLAAAQLQVLSASGANAGALLPVVAEFRSALGGANNGINAHAGSDGRREINWDGVPIGFSAPNTLNANFFNQNSQRGLQLVATPGVSGFMVSDGDASTAGGSNGAGVRFDNLNSGYSSQFTTFSPQKLFTSLGSNVYDVIFFVPLLGPALPGSTRAVVSGFGSVFADVDMPGTTTMEYFDIHDASLGVFAAPTASNGLSFVGVYDTSGPAQIARVRFTLGNAVIGNADNGGNFDIVVADDFIYGEPVAAAVPEPASVLLMTLGSALLVWRRRAQPR
jgi:hypothetical protein